MSTYTALVRWERGEATFLDDKYSRAHTWEFDGGLSVPASASPDIVPSPMAVAANVDPEEAFVASLASCHMLFFLSIAAKRGVIVDRYTDNATGFMEQNERGRMAITRVVLRPEARYGRTSDPTRDEIERMHHQAHGLCFIANSVRTEVVTDVIR